MQHAVTAIITIINLSVIINSISFIYYSVKIILSLSLLIEFISAFLSFNDNKDLKSYILLSFYATYPAKCVR